MNEMAYLWNIVLSTVVLFTVTCALEDTVNTTSGFVRGTRVQNNNIIKFLGIPYAEPPVLGLRFKPPLKKTWTNGILNATKYGFSCPQLVAPPNDDFPGMTGIEIDEDCLTLNVFAPMAASKSAPMSVMVWVHGGGYQGGTTSFYDPTHLVQLNDVIVVNMNYRLGILGFLNTMDENSVGNFGLRDQCLALQWINENIEEFGGNKSSVTIFGESSGASSVTQLTMAASCQGLFHKVIAQSGSALGTFSYNLYPLKSAIEFGNTIGCPTGKTSSLVHCLRGKTINELLAPERIEIFIVGNLSWVPSYTGDFFSFVPKELPVWKGVPIENTMVDFDLMIGLNMEEGEFFYEFTMATQRSKRDILKEVAQGTLPGDPNRADKLLPALNFQYTDWQNPHDNISDNKMLVELFSDVMIHVSSVQYARLHGEFGRLGVKGRTYFYRLLPRGTWMTSNPWTVGATHGDDILFLFGAVQYLNSTTEEKYLGRVMMEYWTNFAKSGNPNEPSKQYIMTEWPIYSPATEKFILLDVNMTNDSISSHPYARRVAFWDEFIPEQVKLIQVVSEPEPCDTDTSSPAGDVYSHISPVLIISIFGLLTAVIDI